MQQNTVKWYNQRKKIEEKRGATGSQRTILKLYVMYGCSKMLYLNHT